MFASIVSHEPHLQGGKLRLKEVNSRAGVQVPSGEAQPPLASMLMLTLKEVWKWPLRKVTSPLPAPLEP